MTTEFDTINAEKELKTAFEVFDKEMRGWIDEAELRRCLTTIGDCLTDVEVGSTNCNILQYPSISLFDS